MRRPHFRVRNTAGIQPLQGRGRCLLAIGAVSLSCCLLAEEAPEPQAVAAAPSQAPEQVACANWVYAGTKSSVCFSDEFIKTTAKETNVNIHERFVPVRLGSETVFEYPFAIMTGEGTFTLLEEERQNFRSYLERGGFVLASAGCSSSEWARAFQAEFKQAFPDGELQDIPMGHSLYRTVYQIAAVTLKNGGKTLLKGLEINGRIVLVYTPEGLNDTGNVKGCCCCGANEIKNSKEINVNIFSYAIMH